MWHCHRDDSEDWLPPHLSPVLGRVLSSLWHSCTTGWAVTSWFEVCCIYTRGAEVKIPCYLITTPSCSPLFWPLYPLKISVSQKNVSIPCIQIGTQSERELETAEILLLVCVASCSTTSTEVTTDERMRGFFSFQIWQLEIKSFFFFFFGSTLEPNASKIGLLASQQEKWWWTCPPGDILYLLYVLQANQENQPIWIAFCFLSRVQMISSNKWVGLNFLRIYLFCPHFFSFGLRCQSTLPWWWIYEGLGKLELNMCIFCKLRRHIKGNSKSSVNSYQPTSVCFSVQLSKRAVPHVLKLYLSWADARLHLQTAIIFCELAIAWAYFGVSLINLVLLETGLEFFHLHSGKIEDFPQLSLFEGSVSCNHLKEAQFCTHRRGTSVSAWNNFWEMLFPTICVTFSVEQSESSPFFDWFWPEVVAQQNWTFEGKS